MVWETLALIGCVLGIFNTFILLKRGLITFRELRDLIIILDAVASATPGTIDDEAVRRLRELVEKYGRGA